MPERPRSPRQRKAGSQIRPSDLSSRIVETLKRELGEGLHGSEEFFTEVALSERFGVSRTPIREALLALERDGLLVQLDRGVGLPKYTLKDMADLFAVRRQLEPYLIRRIVESCEPVKLQSFVQLARSILGSSETEHPYIQTNQSIRRELIALCPNRHIRQAIELFDQQTAYIRQQTLRDPQNGALSLELTLRLVNDISRRDAEAAETTSNAILDAAYQAIQRVMARPAN